MNRFMSPALFLFLGIKLAQASLWDDGYDADILGDSPITPLVTPAPEGGYHEALLRESFGLPPLNATFGGTVFHRLVGRQEICERCNESTPACCRTGGGNYFCCPNFTDVCTAEGWCCPQGHAACPGLPNVCRLPSTETCCGAGVCIRGQTCCGEKCCPRGRFCTEDNRCIIPGSETNSSTITTPTQTSTTSVVVDPPTSNPPSNTVLPFVATVSAPQEDSTVIVETSVSNGVTRTVSRTVATAHNTATNANFQLDGSDAVAMVYPWDPRIVYSPEGAWTSTSSSSTVGTCHNGTKVTTQAGATIQFSFEGKQIALLTCNGSKSGSYTVQVDGNPASTLNGYQAPGPDGDQCIISEPYKSDVMADAAHAITVIVKGSTAGGSNSDATQFEFGGFVYQGSHATGTKSDTKQNLPAIIGGSIGGVLGGIAIIVIIVIIVIRRRRNRRIDNAPAIHQQPAPTPAFTNPTYVSVPTTEYHDPYASSGYGPQHYPNPTGSSGYTSQPPPWAQTNQGPFGSGSFTPSPGRAY